MNPPNTYQTPPVPLFHVTLSTHNFAVSKINPRVKDFIFNFGRQFVQYGQVRMPGGRYVRAAVKVFGAATMDRSEFRFHISQYKDFIDFMQMVNISTELMTFSVKEVTGGDSVSIEMKPNWVARENQQPAISYIEENNEVRSKFVELQTGFGKSMCAVMGLVNDGKRTVIIVKATYIEKWIADVFKYTNATKKEVIPIQGSANLKQLLQLGADGLLTCSFIIIGNRTFQNWLKEYEEFKHDTLAMGYACLPEDFFETVGAGRRLIDEVHQDFHLNFKIDMYTNVEKSVSLSATLINNDPFLENMYKIAYPPLERYGGEPLKKYAHAKAILYSMSNNRFFKTTEAGSTTYSHNAFERSILKSNDFTRAYFELVLSTIRSGFLLDYKKGQRLLVFFASLDMTDAFASYLRKVYPIYDIRKYIGGDDLKDLLEPDICISTLQNAGTAHDIPNLVTVIMTPSVLSIQANIQALGRLREIPGTDVKFYYLACRDIPKQMEYHMQKIRLMEQRAGSMQLLNAPQPV